jgi:hypothetical protein
VAQRTPAAAGSALLLARAVQQTQATALMEPPWPHLLPPKRQSTKTKCKPRPCGRGRLVQSAQDTWGGWLSQVPPQP